jgi:hypothetical protein
MSSIKETGRFTGILYLLVAITGAFSLVYVPSVVIVPGDATATARKITDAELFYRIGILSDLLSQILFTFLVLSLYHLLKDVDKKHARFMLALGLLIVPFGFVNLVNQIAPLILLSGADFLSVFTKPQLDALALGFLRLRNDGILAASAFWGLWLFPFGILVIRSGFFPKILGVLLIVACFAYLTGSFVPLVLPAYRPVVSQITLPLAAIGELSMIGWLLVKGATAA